MRPTRPDVFAAGRVRALGAAFAVSALAFAAPGVAAASGLVAPAASTGPAASLAPEPPALAAAELPLNPRWIPDVPPVIGGDAPRTPVPPSSPRGRRRSLQEEARDADAAVLRRARPLRRPPPFGARRGLLGSMLETALRCRAEGCTTPRAVLGALRARCREAPEGAGRRLRLPAVLEDLARGDLDVPEALPLLYDGDESPARDALRGGATQCKRRNSIME